MGWHGGFEHAQKIKRKGYLFKKNNVANQGSIETFIKKRKFCTLWLFNLSKAILRLYRGSYAEKEGLNREQAE